jgi:hypothetical protein
MGELKLKTRLSLLFFVPQCFPMRIGSRRRDYARNGLTVLAMLGLVCGGSAGVAEDNPSKFATLVEKLDHPAFQTRRDAARQLVEAGVSQTTGVAAQVTAELRNGLAHRSMEVRIASGETLKEIDQLRHDHEMERLLNPRCKPTTIQLAGWKMYSRFAGDDMAARRLFANLSQEYPTALRQLELEEYSECTQILARKLDAFRLPSEDAGGWTMLLLLDIQAGNDSAPNLQSRLAMALSNSAMGPKNVGKRGAEVVRRLIDRWVRAEERGRALRQRLLVAMRYDCRATAAELCDQVFADVSASPSTQVTALLCGLALGRSDLESQARLRLDDDRTAHVWQLIASRKTKIRTQVRDVALAVLLHRHGIDPRKAGFEELQADPVLVFRDHSLGFPSEMSRRESYVTAMNLLPVSHAP